MSVPHVLIVEDEAIAAMATEQMVEDLAGATTEVVDSGERALEACARRRPDLVLMDVRIKGPLTGISTADAIRQRFRVPVVLVTAYSPADLDLAEDAQQFPILSKPLAETELDEMLEALLA